MDNVVFSSQKATRLVKHDFPFINPCWLLLITFLTLMCLKTASRRTCSITFPWIPDWFMLGEDPWRSFGPTSPAQVTEADQSVNPQILMCFLTGILTFAFSQTTVIFPSCHNLSKTVENGSAMTPPARSRITPGPTDLQNLNAPLPNLTLPRLNLHCSRLVAEAWDSWSKIFQ